MQKFVFRITFWWRDGGEKIECEEISNGKTGEKLSIVYFANEFDYTLEIKRSKAEEKKGNKNGGK